MTSYLTDGGGDSTFSHALDVTGDFVYEQTKTDYDANSNPQRTVHKQRFHDATGTGELGDPATQPKARVSYAGMYFDKADRLTESVNVGTNGGSEWTYVSPAPARSDTVLVTSQGYNAAGWVFEVTDPRGIVSQRIYDNLGRTTKTIEAYADGIVSAQDDKTTSFTYDGLNHRRTYRAWLTGGGYQETEFVYGVTGTIYSNDLLATVKHPDKDDGSPDPTEQETLTYNALGQRTGFTDRAGNVHTYSFDVVGRSSSDAVTTLSSAMDGSVRRLETAYDSAGRAFLFTSYNASSGGTVVNQVQRDFNGLGQLLAEYQAHGGAVNTSTSPKIQYAYSNMPSGANHSRLTSMTHPNGRVIASNYSSGLNSDISRLSSLSDDTITLESYDYLGLDTVVRRAHPQPGVDQTYIKLSGSDGEAGDQYIGLDRFGRVIDERWTTSNETDKDRFQYGYDRNGNRLYRDNLLDNTFDELYHADGSSNGYDLLNQLSEFQRGPLNGEKDSISSQTRRQEWNPDALGNFESVTEDSGTAVTRTHNYQNQLLTLSSSTITLTYDPNGNNTKDETGRTFKYDAWNRPIQVNSAARYAYDALNRRISEDTRALFYTADWQVVEERISGVAVVSQVWSPVYIDALIARDRDTDSNGSLDERLYVLADGNWNVTALVNTSGAVQERYAYDPYGKPKVYDVSFTERTAGSSYFWVNLHQGGRRDGDTGNYHFRFRDQNSQQMRWNRTDPIEFDGGDPNLYRSEANNPVTDLDPTGLLVTIRCGPVDIGHWTPFGRVWGQHCAIVVSCGNLCLRIDGGGIDNRGPTLRPCGEKAPTETDWPTISPFASCMNEVLCLLEAFLLIKQLPYGPPKKGTCPNSNTFAKAVLDHCGISFKPLPRGGVDVPIDYPPGAVCWKFPAYPRLPRQPLLPTGPLPIPFVHALGIQPQRRCSAI